MEMIAFYIQPERLEIKGDWNPIGIAQGLDLSSILPSFIIVLPGAMRDAATDSMNFQLRSNAEE